LNDNNRKIENDFTRIFYSGNLAVSRQLNAAGRAINANYSYTYNPTILNKDFTSTSNYYNEKGLVQGVQDLLQHHDMDVSLNTMAAGIGFINPINKKLSFYTNYNYDFQKDENNTKAYNEKGGLNELILPQSSHYALSQNKHRLGGSVFYKTKKCEW
jgi:Outer membrane protein beta-barrel family